MSRKGRHFSSLYYYYCYYLTHIWLEAPVRKSPCVPMGSRRVHCENWAHIWLQLFFSCLCSLVYWRLIRLITNKYDQPIFDDRTQKCVLSVAYGLCRSQCTMHINTRKACEESSWLEVYCENLVHQSELVFIHISKSDFFSRLPKDSKSLVYCQRRATVDREGGCSQLTVLQRRRTESRPFVGVIQLLICVLNLQE